MRRSRRGSYLVLAPFLMMIIVGVAYISVGFAHTVNESDQLQNLTDLATYAGSQAGATDYIETLSNGATQNNLYVRPSLFANAYNQIFDANRASLVNAFPTLQFPSENNMVTQGRLTKDPSYFVPSSQNPFLPAPTWSPITIKGSSTFTDKWPFAFPLFPIGGQTGGGLQSKVTLQEDSGTTVSP